MSNDHIPAERPLVPKLPWEDFKRLLIRIDPPITGPNKVKHL